MTVILTVILKTLKEKHPLPPRVPMLLRDKLEFIYDSESR